MIIIFTGFVILLTITLVFISFKLALAVFGGSMLIVIVFFRPFWGLLLYIALTYLRPQEFVAGLKGLPIMQLMAVVIIGTMILHKTFRREPFESLKMPQTIFMFIFLALIPLSQLQFFYLTGAKNSFVSFLPQFMLFFMLVSLVNDLEELRKTYLLLFILTLALAINGIYQYHHGTDIAGQTMIHGRIRWIGIFEDPNDLGLTILVFTPFAIINLLDKTKSLPARFIWFIFFCLLTYALYLTNSRGTFLGLIAVLIYFSIQHLGWIRGLILGAILLTISLAAGPGRLSEISMEESSASGRLDAWATGLSLFLWRPILGVGYGNFTEYHHLTAHNSVVLCMSELGIAGLFVWMLMLVKSFRQMMNINTSTTSALAHKYTDTMQMAIIGFFVSAFFLSRTYNAVFYILIALASITACQIGKQVNIEMSLIGKKTLIANMVSILLLILMIKLLLVI